MIYNFTDDLSKIRKSYKESSDMYKNLDFMQRKTDDQGSQIGSGYSLDDYEIPQDGKPVNSKIQDINKTYQGVIGSEYNLPTKANTNPMEEIADNDDYVNLGKIADGYESTVSSIEKTSELTGEGAEAFSGKTGSAWKGTGSTSDIVSSGAGLATDMVSGFSTVSGSEKESWAQTGKWALQGGKLGMQVGGPIGAGIGSVAGAAAGVIDTFGDITKRNTANRKKINDENQQRFTDIELSDYQNKNESRVKNLIQLRKNQLNYIDLDKY